MRRPGRPEVLTGVVVAVSLAAAVLVAVSTGGGSVAASTAVRPHSLPGELTGPAPWPRNIRGLTARLAALGLPALKAEGEALHTHERLAVYVNGRRVPVPAGIGLDPEAGVISPLHTHDATGTIHVESPRVRTFTLGEFFGVWGVRFTPRCLGGYCAGDGKRVWVVSDGRLVEGDPRKLPLEDGQTIVVAFGSRAQAHGERPA